MSTPAIHGRAMLRHRSVHPIVPWLFGLCGLLLAQAVLAGSLQVAPISLEFAPDEQAQGLWLSNSGDTPIRAQVRVQEWIQVDGKEQLLPTRELAASPPILEIAPGQQQLVRIVRLQPLVPAREMTYRLLVDELPGSGQPTATGLQFLLRYSIPVFVLPQGKTPSNAPREQVKSDLSTLSASLQGNGDTATLTLDNAGRQRVRLSQLVHVDAKGTRTELIPGLVGYVLAGQRMQWPVPLKVEALHSGELKAKFNDDQQEQSLSLDRTGR